MAKIYIRNHDRYAVVLEYEPGVGPVRQIEREKLPDDIKEDKGGFYVEVNGVFAGVFSSKDGPVFFHKNSEYFLADARYTAEVQKKTDEHTFVLKYNGQVCLQIKYPPVKYKDYDNWSDETFLDFFLWLANLLNSNRERFVRYRTLCNSAPEITPET